MAEDKTIEVPVRKIRAEHKSELQTLIKVIQTADIHDSHKQILLLRLWGQNPENFRPLSQADIAVKYQRNLRSIQQLEKEAKMAIKVYLTRVDVKDAVKKFNRQFDKNKFGILNAYEKPFKI